MKYCHLVYPKIVEKKWGREIWVHNCEEYCGKILEIKKDHSFSLHYHISKKETFYVLEGKMILKYVDPDKGEHKNIELKVGDIIEVPRGAPHQIICLENGKIAEFSTTHSDEDSYRIFPSV